MRYAIFLLTLLVCSTSYSCDSITVAGSDQWLPFAYSESDSNTPTGIAYDVVRLIGKKLNIPVNFNTGLPWKRIELGMETGSIDLLAGNYWNAERAESWHITDAFANDEVRIFVRSGHAFPFDSLKDLEGRSGVMPRGISFGQAFDQYKSQLDIHEVQQHTQMFAMLNLGRIDYMVLPYLNGQIKTKNLGFQGKIIALKNNVSVNGVHLSLSKKSDCRHLLPQINKVIQRAKDRGTIKDIIKQYLK